MQILLHNNNLLKKVSKRYNGCESAINPELKGGTGTFSDFYQRKFFPKGK